MTTTEGNHASTNVVDVSSPGAVPYVELSATNFGEILSLTESMTNQGWVVTTPAGPMVLGYKQVKSILRNPEWISLLSSFSALDQMENVLNGEEQLEIALEGSISPSEIEKRKLKGEVVKLLSMDKMSMKLHSHSNDSASDYINKNLKRFKSGSHSSLSTKGKWRTPKKNTFRAGARAFIEVDGDLTSYQEEQLRSITSLVRSILKEK